MSREKTRLFCPGTSDLNGTGKGLIDTGGKLCCNNQIIAKLSTFILHHFQTKNLSITQTDKQTPNVTDSTSYSHDVFKQPFPDTKPTPITTKEIKDIINPFPIQFKTLVPGQKSRVFSRDI